LSLSPNRFWPFPRGTGGRRLGFSSHPHVSVPVLCTGTFVDRSSRRVLFLAAWVYFPYWGLYDWEIPAGSSFPSFDCLIFPTPGLMVIVLGFDFRSLLICQGGAFLFNPPLLGLTRIRLYPIDLLAMEFVVSSLFPHLSAAPAPNTLFFHGEEVFPPESFVFLPAAHILFHPVDLSCIHPPSL